MGKVTRQPQEKHKLSLSPAVSEFVQKVHSAPLAELPALFKTWGQRWPYPRGDLMNWVLPLDRFDQTLETFNTKYGLDHGPQRVPFGTALLREGSPGYDETRLQELGFGADGDAELIEAILDFSRLLVEKCANRTIYNSTDRLNCLLNTTSLSLLHRTLRLTIFLAQRYSERLPSPNPAIRFYEYDHDRLRQLASPISYSIALPKRGPPSPLKTTKGKDKVPGTRPRRSSTAVNPNDFRELCRETSTHNAPSKAGTISDREWSSCVNVKVVWSPRSEDAKPSTSESRSNSASTPSTPTPLRRHTSSQQNNHDVPMATNGDPAHDGSTSNIIEYTPADLASTTIESILGQMPDDLPPDKQYELLHKLRVAYGLMSSSQSRQNVLAIRVLAINAIGNVFNDEELSRHLLTQEHGSLKPQELIQQLVSLLQDQKKGQQPVRLYMQTLSMETIGVLARHKLFATDINAALGASSSSGLLLRLTQRGLKDISTDDDEADDLEGDDWREAVFSMPRVVIEASGQHGRSSENVISPDFVEVYISGFNKITGKAMRIHLRMLDFAKTYFHHFKDGLQVLLASGAFETTSNLLRILVEEAWQLFQSGKGIEQFYKTKLTDYQISYQHQQIIRSIIDMINDISGHQGPHADRVLRSLVDSQALLTAFKLILDNLGPFGAHTWSELVKAICCFLNNEPTSYTVIAEAGIIKSFLGTVTNQETPEIAYSGQQHISSASKQEAPGIPASIDAIVNVAQAFEAICLTNTGFDFFKVSGALEKFFQIFESPAHVKVMKEANSLRALGGTFDELVRHHPGLKTTVTSAVIVMLARVRHIGRSMAFESGAGSKLWLLEEQSKRVCGGKEALLTEIVPPPRADAPSQDLRPIHLPSGNTLDFNDSIQLSVNNSSGAFLSSGGTIERPSSSTTDGDPQQVASNGVWQEDQDQYGLNVSDYIKPAVGFLSTFVSKTSMCNTFLDCGAADIIIDFITLPSIPACGYPFGLQGFIDELGSVIRVLAEAKPHVILPVLTDRAKYACQQLQHFSQCQPHDISCYFGPLVQPHEATSSTSDITRTGTHIIRSMMAVYCLSHVLGELFNAPLHNTRSAQNYLFDKINLADQFADLCGLLGSVAAACHREEIALQRTIKDTWLKATRPENFSTGDDDVDQILSVWDTSQNNDSASDPESKPRDVKKEAESLRADRQTPAFKNVKTLRYLLIDTPAAITELMSNLGHGIVGKRRTDTFTKQKIALVANALAKAYIDQLQPYFLRNGQTMLDKDAKFAYLVIALSNVRNSFYDDVHTTGVTDACQSYVIEAFKRAGGVRLLAQIGTDFFDELKQCKVEHSMFSANTGLKICLDTLDELTNAKSIVESPQASVLKNTDPSKAFYFNPQQLLLELRMEALPLTRLIWDSEYADQASRDVVQKLIAVLNHVLSGDSESDAIRTQSSRPPILPHTPRKYHIDPLKVNTLKEKGFDEELAREALYRSHTTSSSNTKSAEEYCEAMMANPRRQRLPVPSGDTDVAATTRETPAAASPPTLNASASDLFNAPGGGIDAALAEVVNNASDGNEMEGVTAPASAVPESSGPPSLSGTSAMDLSNMLNGSQPSQREPPQPEPPQQEESKYSVETIEAERKSIREELVERCNNILNSHQNLAFELADLISSAAKKISDDTAKTDFWENAADILTMSLISMQEEEMTEAHARKLTAAAHLTALIIQDDDVFRLTLNIYQQNFESFLGFLELSADSSRKGEQAYPWIPPILLIIERMLAKDCEPEEARFDPPRDLEHFTVATLTASYVCDMEEKRKLFDILVKLLPKVGKDKQMALSIARVLVMLTRHREIAALLAEKKNLQKLFLMIKQLAGVGQGRLLSSFMIVLRHMLEDQDTLKQIMRSEIIASFTGRNTNRAVDIATYIKELYWAALRDPEAFVVVTKDMLKFSSWQPQPPGPGLVLRKHPQDDEEQTHSSEAVPQQVSGGGEPSDQAAASVENADDQQPEIDQQKTSEIKPPVVEHPDGVIHFILSELLMYKDVDDKEIEAKRIPATEGQDSSEPDNSLVSAANGIVAASDRLNAVTRQLSGGQDLADEASSESGSDVQDATDIDKTRFKPEDHPIYVYRCFLLSCLVEVLHAYTRTKVELINFSRKSDPMAVTPSKPRSGILNYILNGLISSGYVDKDNKSMHCKKKIVTSDWACKVVVALCAKTGERGISSPAQRYSTHPQIDDNDDEPDLTFVRRFVLEHAIRAYKDATSSTEPLQMKYSRLLCFSDMFNRLLSKPTSSEGSAGAHNTSYKVLGKLMFEKNLVSVLTSSLAEIDLSHSFSRRVIKFILKPLQELTTVATQLSLTSPDLVAPILGNTSDDDISSASSVSEVNDDREETPDLYRNSALGMLDPNRAEESDSQSDQDEDEEMYDEEDYGDEMEYDEEVANGQEGDEAVSDEEEGDGGLPPGGPIEGLPGDVPMDIEFVVGDPNMEVDDDDDENSDEDSDDEDDDEDDEDGEIMIEGEDGEINADDENDSLGDGPADEGEWEDEDGEEADEDDQEDADDDEGQEIEFDGGDIDIEGEAPPGIQNNLNNLLRVLGGRDDEIDIEIGTDDRGVRGPVPSNLIVDAGEGEGDLGDAGDEDEEDEDEEMDENLDYEDFDNLMDGGEDFLEDQWGFEEPAPRPPRIYSRRHAASRVMRGIPPDFLSRRLGGPEGFAPALGGYARMPGRRGGRPDVDDGRNPLLQRPPNNGGRPPMPAGEAVTISRHLGQGFPPELAGLMPMPMGGGLPTVIHSHDGNGRHGAMLDAIVSALHRTDSQHGRSGRSINLSFNGPGFAELRDALQPPIGAFHHRVHHHHHHHHPAREDVMHYVRFHPSMTSNRWQEEARLVFGRSHLETAARLSKEIQSELYPGLLADEKERQRQAAEEKQRLQAEEEARQKAEAEEQLRKETEEQERQAKERIEEQQRQQAEADADVRAAEAAAEAADNEIEGTPSERGDGDTEAMEDVQPTDTDQRLETAVGEEAGPSAEAQPEQPRAFTTIRGRQLDITGLDIDREYLEALPEDLREEVIMQQYATRREEAQQQTGDADTSGIDPDFLNALPEDIRDEIRQQEAHAQRRRERDEARRQQAQAAGPTQPGEMDNDDFFATLDPALRRAILAEQPAEILNQLAPRHAQEGREHARRLFHFSGMPVNPNAPLTRDPRAGQRDLKRQVVQLIDKAGVATLLRLMFLPQQGSLRANLWHILRNVSGNRQTRFEVINMILVILKEGSTDVTAVERSLASLSLRAKATAPQKTPQPLKRSLSMQPSAGLAEEVTPLVVVQQCLSALKQLSQHGFHIRTIFLREVDISANPKSKKGKARDTKTTKYPVNDLISLLDRKLIMESSSCLQSLAELLAAVTSPLVVLMRKEKEKPEQKKDEPQSEETNQGDGASSAQQGPIPELPSAPNDAIMTDVAAHPQEASHTEQAVAEQSTIEAQANAPEGEAVSPADKDKTTTAGEEAQPKKKFEPPVIPESNLQLIVSIFVAQECTSETFHAALDTMSSISTIPETSAVFSQELIGHVKHLSESIRSDIEDFLPVLREAQVSTDLHGPTASKFSQSGSDQVKLLQVLKALDYLAAPKKDETSDDATAKSILTSSYEGLSLGPLWSKLSECLTLMSEKDNVIAFATMMLPLIESLMVVCKNTSLKDAPLARQITQSQVPTTPTVEDSGTLEKLFFNFTTEHRKILNDIIRQSPKLMQGTGSFNLLVKNPKVLDFDNKRAFFTKQIHSRLHQQRHVQPPLQLNVRRDQVFQDSYKGLYFKSAEEMKYGKLNIRFNGEEGVDAGGVTREWFQVLARGIFNADWALWEPVAADKTTFHPSKLSWVNGEHLLYFKFVGRIIGKALHEGRVLDCHFSRAVYKRMLGKQPTLRDLESMDLDYYKSLQWILENDIGDAIMEDFSVNEEQFGETKVIDLIPNGRNVSVTEQNKHEYVQKIVEYRLFDSVKDQMHEFAKGFHDIIPAELIAIFDEQELELLISGLPEIDVDDWKANTEYHNYNANSPQVTWFWRIVRAMSNEERAKLLQFITGTSKVPLNGFKDLEGMQGTTRFSIHKDPSQNRLPTSHTCFNQLDLPAYDNQDTLKTSLMTAINLGADYFGFA